MKRICKDAFSAAGPIQETCSSGQGAARQIVGALGELKFGRFVLKFGPGLNLSWGLAVLKLVL